MSSVQVVLAGVVEVDGGRDGNARVLVTSSRPRMCQSMLPRCAMHRPSERYAVMTTVHSQCGAKNCPSL